MARRGVPGGGVPPVRHRSESVAVETQGPGSLYSLSGCAAGGGHPAPFVTPEVVNALERHLRWLRKKRCVAAGASLVVVPERRGPPARRVMGQEGVQAHAQEREAARVLAARSRLANVCRRYHTTAGHRLSSDHLAKWRRGESNPGQRGLEVIHGPINRALISFDYPKSARQIPSFGHRVPKSSSAMLQASFVSPAQTALLPACSPATRDTGFELGRRAQSEEIRFSFPRCQFTWLRRSRGRRDR